MRVAVLNFSGNVGKSTIARHCLAPRMNNCPVFFVESINEGGDSKSNIKGRDFAEVLVEISALDKAVVDIGSSNIEQVFTQLKRMTDSHEDFDYYVIPTVPTLKQQKDTRNIYVDLVGLGIDPSKIKIVLNQVEPDSDPNKEFSTLMGSLEDFEVSFDAVLHLNEVYPMLSDMTIDQAIADGVDFKAKIASENDPEIKRDIARALGVSRLAKTAKKELDAAFDSMFKG